MVDHRDLRTKTVKRRKITLDTAETDLDALTTMLAERMGVEIDYVHGTTSVVARYVTDSKTPGDPAPADDD